jgi:hypothetical protein
MEEIRNDYLLQYYVSKCNRNSSVKRMRQDRTGQDRTGQDRTGQGRAGQGRAGQGRGQGRTGQTRAGQGRAGQDRAGQDRTGQDRTGQGRAGQDRTRWEENIYVGFSGVECCDGNCVNLCQDRTFIVKLKTIHHPITSRDCRRRLLYEPGINKQNCILTADKGEATQWHLNLRRI